MNLYLVRARITEQFPGSSPTHSDEIRLVKAINEDCAIDKFYDFFYGRNPNTDIVSLEVLETIE